MATKKNQARHISVISVLSTVALLLATVLCSCSPPSLPPGTLNKETPQNEQPYPERVSIAADYVMTEDEKSIQTNIRFENGKLIVKENKLEYFNTLYFDGDNVIFAKFDGEYTFYKYSISGSKVKHLGGPFIINGYRAEMTREHIYIIAAVSTEGNPGEWTSNCILYEINPFAETMTVVKEYSSFWLPTIFVHNNYVLVNLHGTKGLKLFSQLDCYNPYTKEYRTLVEANATYGTDDTLTGEDIYICGGDEENAFYQVLVLDGIIVAEARNTKIMKISLTETNPEPIQVYTSEYSLQHIAAKDNILVIRPCLINRFRGQSVQIFCSSRRKTEE